MKRSHLIPPVLMGAMMGAMGLMMYHGQMTGTGTVTGAGLGFVLAHLAVAALVFLAAALGLKNKLPVLHKLAAHHPGLRHIAIMITAALMTALTIHLIHGGPTWT